MYVCIYMYIHIYVYPQLMRSNTTGFFSKKFYKQTVVCCSVFQCLAMWCSVLQCVAVCCIKKIFATVPFIFFDIASCTDENCIHIYRTKDHIYLYIYHAYIKSENDELALVKNIFCHTLHISVCI